MLGLEDGRLLLKFRKTWKTNNHTKAPLRPKATMVHNFPHSQLHFRILLHPSPLNCQSIYIYIYNWIFYRCGCIRAKFRALSKIGLTLFKFLMPPPNLTLPNNQRLPWNPGEAPAVTMEASDYPNAPTRTCSGDFQVGFSWVAFAHGHCFIY